MHLPMHNHTPATVWIYDDIFPDCISSPPHNSYLLISQAPTCVGAQLGHGTACRAHALQNDLSSSILFNIINNFKSVCYKSQENFQGGDIDASTGLEFQKNTPPALKLRRIGPSARGELWDVETSNFLLNLFQYQHGENMGAVPNLSV